MCSRYRSHTTPLLCPCTRQLAGRPLGPARLAWPTHRAPSSHRHRDIPEKACPPSQVQPDACGTGWSGVRWWSQARPRRAAHFRYPWQRQCCVVSNGSRPSRPLWGQRLDCARGHQTQKPPTRRACGGFCWGYPRLRGTARATTGSRCSRSRPAEPRLRRPGRSPGCSTDPRMTGLCTPRRGPPRWAAPGCCGSG
jgi:hypothetical protein